MSTVALTSLRCRLVGPSPLLDPALAATLFTPSPFSGYLELTSTGRTVFCFCSVQKEEAAAQPHFLVLTVPVTSTLTLSFHCTETVPLMKGDDGKSIQTGVISPTATQVLVQDPLFCGGASIAPSPPAVGSTLKQLREGRCPWISDIAAAEIEQHLKKQDQRNRGILITGDGGCGRRNLALAISEQQQQQQDRGSIGPLALDCAELAQLCVLHSSASSSSGNSFNVQTAIRNVLQLWTRHRPLVLLNIDILDGGLTLSSGGDSAAPSSSSVAVTHCSLPERARRIILLELSSAFRERSGLLWIATAASSSPIAAPGATTALTRWIGATVVLGPPEYAQRKSLFESFPSLKNIGAESMRRLLYHTHGWNLRRLCCGDSASEIDAVLRSPDSAPTAAAAGWGEHPTKIFGLEEDLQVIRDACITPLCTVARGIREGTFDISQQQQGQQQQTSSSRGNIPVALPKGVLCVGPAGCGKTLLLKHLARELATGSDGNVSVILQDTLALVQKEVGATEMSIHRLFERARASAPCVLLLDQIDSIAAPRSRASSGADSSAQVADRMLSTLLVEMDGVGSKTPRDSLVLVVATAASLDCLDAAIRRPGRLDIHVHMRPPTREAAAELVLHKLGRALPSPAGEQEQQARNFLLEDPVVLTPARLKSFAEVESFCVSRLIQRASFVQQQQQQQQQQQSSDDGDDDDSVGPRLNFETFAQWCDWVRI